MAKKIMILGTGSSVGKSITVAGICRALVNRGIKACPFKSQNMSNFSSITDDGFEMSSAQVAQAEAAKMAPVAEMNPILLKPSSDTGSEVVVLGKHYANMNARRYYEEKQKLLPIAVDAFKKLEKNVDIMVIEGAGSAAEINLRQMDIVNLGFAKEVDANCILVGDIDKGGVFASIYGTYMLMEPEEKERIVGFIINKFRGDISLLMPGIKEIEEKINLKCLGVIPYLKNIKIEDEDSANDSSKTYESRRNIPPAKIVPVSESKDKEYNRIADNIQKNLDLDKIIELAK